MYQLNGESTSEALDWLSEAAQGPAESAEDVLDWIKGIGGGAASGAAAGLGAGPWGALAGGLIGGTMGAVNTAQQQGRRPSPRPAPQASPIPPTAPSRPPAASRQPPSPAANAAHPTAAPGVPPELVHHLAALLPQLVALVPQLIGAFAQRPLQSAEREALERLEAIEADLEHDAEAVGAVVPILLQLLPVVLPIIAQLLPLLLKAVPVGLKAFSAVTSGQPGAAREQSLAGGLAEGEQMFEALAFARQEAFTPDGSGDTWESLQSENRFEDRESLSSDFTPERWPAGEEGDPETWIDEDWPIEDQQPDTP